MTRKDMMLCLKILEAASVKDYGVEFARGQF
jgi:hypothetical protein